MEMSVAKPFHFKKFTIHQEHCAMKVGTDGVLLGAWTDVQDVSRILDIGAGSGLIAIMLAQRTEAAFIQAVEIDEAASRQAMENARLCEWRNRLEVLHTSVQAFAKNNPSKYDLIVSNPPFFSGGTFSDNQDRNDVRHAVKLPHGELLSAVRNLLAGTGRFCLILPLIEGLRFKELAGGYRLYCTKLTRVKPKADKPVERLLMQFERKEKILLEGELIIQQEKRNDWTEAFRKLTGEFYLEK